MAMRAFNVLSELYSFSAFCLRRFSSRRQKAKALSLHTAYAYKHYKRYPPPVKRLPRLYRKKRKKREPSRRALFYECLRVNAVLPLSAVSIYVVKLKCFHLALPRLYSLTDCMRMSVTGSDDVTGARQ